MAKNKPTLRRTEKNKARKNHIGTKDLQNGFLFGIGREIAISLFDFVSQFLE